MQVTLRERYLDMMPAQVRFDPIVEVADQPVLSTRITRPHEQFELQRAVSKTPKLDAWPRIAEHLGVPLSRFEERRAHAGDVGTVGNADRHVQPRHRVAM